MSATTRSGPWLPPVKIVETEVRVRQGNARSNKARHGKARHMSGVLSTTGENWRAEAPTLIWKRNVRLVSDSAFGRAVTPNKLKQKQKCRAKGQDQIDSSGICRTGSTALNRTLCYSLKAHDKRDTSDIPTRAPPAFTTACSAFCHAERSIGVNDNRNTWIQERATWQDCGCAPMPT